LSEGIAVKVAVDCVHGAVGLLDWISDKVLGPVIVGLLLAFVGSFFLARFEEHYRSKRDHLSHSVDALRQQLEALLTVASAYWSSPHRVGVSPGQEAEIEFRLADITNLTQICASDLWQKKEDVGPGLVAALMRSIVTPEYGSRRRKPRAAQPQRIAAAAAALASAVTQSRMQYVKSGPFSRR
jgi:hypothetical protein